MRCAFEVVEKVSNPVSQIRQNFHPECEAAINKQIGEELQACYLYFGMNAFFQRDEAAFPEATKFFQSMIFEEMTHAHKVLVGFFS